MTVVVGILGGGQLGKMMLEAASPLGLQVRILDGKDAPAGQLCGRAGDHVHGDFRNSADIQPFAKQVDVLTFEIEHVNADAVREAARQPNERGAPIDIQPSPDTIQLIQNKFRQKEHLRQKSQEIPLPEYVDAPSVDAIREAGRRFRYPMMLKSKTMAYDGRGNAVIRSEADIAQAVKSLGGEGSSLYVEKWVPFVKELAVMVAKGVNGGLVAYDVVETIQEDSICSLVLAPARIPEPIRKRASHIAMKAIEHLGGFGIYGVELFLLENGTILLNEIAPRPHNSGHFTIEACHTSQFEQHLRAVARLPLGSAQMKVGAAVMVNIIGKQDGEEGMRQVRELCNRALSIPGASLHWYGKNACRSGRKMAHITMVGDNVDQLLQALAKEYPSCRKAIAKRASPLVSVIMGSDSDLTVMRACGEFLERFGVPFELTIVSAHRTPARMMDFASSAHERGIRVIIAAAGGAAHLPGMVAALTPLPVIGVPVALKFLDGQDSLYSIVQMPRGVPVATVAINNSTNAALLAIRILGSYDRKYLEALQAYQREMEQTVMDKVQALETQGWKEYH